MVRGLGNGIAIVQVRARGIEGVNVFTVDTDSTPPRLDDNGFEVDVYPRAITLPLLGQRQLKVTLPDHTNISAASAGTHYFLSDSAIADVTSDGLIHAKATGSVKLSIINGGMQHDIMLNVQAPDIGTAIVKDNAGAVVQDLNGNMLMVAPGSLPEGTAVSINALDLADVGIPLPAPDIVPAIAAIEINTDGLKSALPLQLAIKVKDPINPDTGLPEALATGTQVFFWKKGTIQDTDGSSHDTWWLIDNGVIGDDGMARTSSPPYSGVTGGNGVYLVTTSKVSNDQTGEIQVSNAMVNFNVIWAQMAMIAMAPTPFMATAALGILETIPFGVAALNYTLYGSFKKELTASDFSLANIKATFPAPPSLSVNTPSITGMDFNPDTRKLKLTGVNFIPSNQAPGNFQFRVWLVPRGYQITKPTAVGSPLDRGLIWQGFNVASLPDILEITLPDGVALSMHDIYIERFSINSTPDGQGLSDLSVRSGPISGWQGANVNTLITTAHGIDVLTNRKVDATTGVITNIPLTSITSRVTKNEQGHPLDLYGQYTDQIAYSEDGSLAYIAGANSNIYVFDTQTQSVVYTLPVINSTSRLTSLAVANGWLYVTEGNTYGASGGRLIRININQTSFKFLLEQQIVEFGVKADYGFQDMAVNNGSYLALTAPTSPIPLSNNPGGDSGNVYVIDLVKIDKNGQVPTSAVLPIDAGKFQGLNSGKAPQYISSGQNYGEFLLSSAKNINSGLIGLTVMEKDGGLASSTISGVNGQLTLQDSDPDWMQRKFQENIQRAAGNVVVEYNQMEYAFVADYNFIFNDVHWRNSDMLGKQIGGKIGVIQDPFGKTKDGPKFLGATTPIVGGAVDHLTLSADGKLYADVFLEEVTDVDKAFKSIFVWDAASLIQAALDEQGKTLSKPIDRKGIYQIPDLTPKRYDGPSTGQEYGWTYGIGSYKEFSGPVVLNETDSFIRLNEAQLSSTPVETIEEQLNPNDYLISKIIIKGLDLLVTGGYFERYDQRVQEYNEGKIETYEQFRLANIDDIFATGFATVTTLGIVSKANFASTLLNGAVFGTAGATFDLLLQASLVHINEITDGGSGKSEISWSEALMAGGLGFALHGILGKLGSAVVGVYERAPKLIEDLLLTIDDIASMGTDRSFVLAMGQNMASVTFKKLYTATQKNYGVKKIKLDNLKGKTEIYVGEKLVLTTPEFKSKTVAEASAWYREQMDNLAGMIDKKLSVVEQIIQADQLSRLILKGARATLYDQGPKVANKFEAEFLPPTIARLRTDLTASGITNDIKLNEEILKRLTAPVDKALKWFEFGGSWACFAAGTLVHTKEGLVPIENIKEGDWVLSKPENGGEQAYKRVLRTFAHAPTRVMRIRYFLGDDWSHCYPITTTLNHPFWVVDQGWMAAKDLGDEIWAGGKKLELSDASQATIQGTGNIYVSEQPGVGWLPSHSGSTDWPGYTSHGYG